MFNLSTEDLNAKKGMNTATEIHQQPEVWGELIQSLQEQKDTLMEFVGSIYNKHGNVRVILTGAGTSAFIGDTIVPELRKHSGGKVQFEAIATTNIVSNPTEYLFPEVPTIMVSFARSGNSPESVASVNLGEQMIKDFYQVIITCNKDGKLAVNTKDDDNAITILTPDKAHDKGFAMTSSFTCMIIAAYGTFAMDAFHDGQMKQVMNVAESLIEKIANDVDDILSFDFNRVVYLGSGILGQLAHEASLKMLELSAGQAAAIYESSLGFRHGPKSILNDESLVVLFMSQDAYTRKYDVDILRELAADDSAMKVVAVTDQKDKEVEELADWTITVNDTDNAFNSDFHLALLYIIVAQTLAFKKSLQLGITPDNPSPNGKVNRVVKGVTIYDYE